MKCTRLKTRGLSVGEGPRRPAEEIVMHMLDWNTYRQQLAAAVGSLGKL
jgi:hypothetical protein